MSNPQGPESAPLTPNPKFLEKWIIKAISHALTYENQTCLVAGSVYSKEVVSELTAKIPNLHFWPGKLEAKVLDSLEDSSVNYFEVVNLFSLSLLGKGPYDLEAVRKIKSLEIKSIEDLPNCAEYVRRAARLVKPSGELVITEWGLVMNCLTKKALADSPQEKEQNKFLREENKLKVEGQVPLDPKDPPERVFNAIRAGIAGDSVLRWPEEVLGRPLCLVLRKDPKPTTLPN